MAKPLRTFFKGSLFTFWIKKKRRRSKSRKRQIYLRAGGGGGQGGEYEEAVKNQKIIKGGGGECGQELISRNTKMTKQRGERQYH